MASLPKTTSQHFFAIRWPTCRDQAYSMNTNVLYYGDNLDILRRYIPDESVDLVYLDPSVQLGPELQRHLEGRVGAEVRP